MSSDGANAVALPLREDLHRELRPRPHVKLAFYLMSVVASLVVCHTLLLLVARLLSTESTQAISNFEILVNLTLSVGCFVQAYHVIRPQAFAHYELMRESLAVIRTNDRKLIPFGQIEAIQFRHPMISSGGFRLKMSDGSSHFISGSLERPDYILDSLRSSRPELFRNQNDLDFRAMSILIDHAYARFYDSLKDFRRLLQNFVFLPATVTACLILGANWSTQNVTQGFITVLLSNGILHTIFGMLSETFLGTRTRKLLKVDPLAVRRDLALENIVFRASDSFVLLTWILVITYFSF